jgi:hypothetical protein
VWCGVVWCGVVWCGVVWCGVVWCGVVEMLCKVKQKINKKGKRTERKWRARRKRTADTKQKAIALRSLCNRRVIAWKSLCYRFANHRSLWNLKLKMESEEEANRTQ